MTNPNTNLVTPALGRRTFLTALGVGAAVSAAGCLGAAEADDPAAGDGGDAGTVDPQFGFVGRSLDEAAPVEIDHEVHLLMGTRASGSPIPEFYFDPVGLAVASGDTVKFVLDTPDHTITAFHPQLGRTQRVPDDVPAISSPVLGAGTYWLFKFETPGVYDLYCAPHEPYGMAMRVVVDEVSGPATDPVSTEPPQHGEPRPPMATSATVLNDEALAPDAVVERGKVVWADLDPESKKLQE